MTVGGKPKLATSIQAEPKDLKTWYCCKKKKKIHEILRVGFEPVTY